MTDPDDIKKKPSDLLTRAEKSLGKRSPVPKDVSALSRQEVERLVHELRVHQIELEMQNEELRETEKLLSESLDRFSDLYEYAPVGYFILGKDGLILEVNVTGAGLLAVDRSSLIGKPFYRFLVKEYADAFYLHIQEVFEAGTKRRCGLELRKSDGTMFDAQLASLAIEDRDGRVTQCRTIVSDITEHKQAEEELRESEARFRTLVEGAPEAIFVQSGGRFVYINAAMASLLGASRPEELLGKEFMAQIAPEYREAVRERIRFQCETGKPAPLMEQEYLRLDGSRVPVETTAMSIRFQGSDAHMVFIRDITKRKLAEEALRESEAKFRAIIENMQDVFYRTDNDGNLIMLSPSGARLLGLDSADLSYGMNVAREFYAIPDERDRLLQALKANGAVSDYDVTLKRPDGSLMFVSTNSQIYRDVNGEPLGVEGVFRDITQRKLGEETIREAERKYRSIFENSREGIYQSTPEGRYLTANPEMAKIYGYSSPGEMVSSITSIDREIFVIPEKRGELKQLIATKGAVRGFEVEQRRKDGSIFWASLNVHAVYADDGTIRYWEGRSIDITARVQQDREIKLLNRLYSVLSQVSQAVVQVTTPEAFLIETCRVIVEEGGFVLSWIGQVEAETKAVVPVATWGEVSDYVRGITVFADDRPEGRGPTGTCIRERRPSVHNDFLHSPLTQPWSERAQPFGIRAAAGFPIESGGRAWGALTIYSDEIDFFGIEDVKLLERVASNIGFALDNFERERQRRLAQEESERLEIQLRQAEKLEVIGTLAGGIAHGFNNILGIIMGYVDLVRSAFSEESRDKRSLDTALIACLRGKQLVQQILVFSRMESKIERQPVNLGTLINESLGFLRASLPTTIEIRRELSDNDLLVSANVAQIRQILTNLATNAAHAMEERGGILEVSLTEVAFDAGALLPHGDIKPGPYVKLTVSDTGHGMDAWTLERIFDPCFTTKEVGKGSGLGLSVVQGIVTQHEGVITVRSDPGEGTTFDVYLPRIESQATIEVEPQEFLPNGTERILFVDDEPALADIGRIGLELLGYAVVAKTDSIEALELFRAQPEQFDLVITDYTMPRMTGVELAQEMMRIRPDIPVILCTGYNEMISEAAAKNLGICAFLVKPVSLLGTAETIRKVLETRQS